MERPNHCTAREKLCPVVHPQMTWCPWLQDIIAKEARPWGQDLQCTAISEVVVKTSALMVHERETDTPRPELLNVTRSCPRNVTSPHFSRRSQACRINVVPGDAYVDCLQLSGQHPSARRHAPGTLVAQAPTKANRCVTHEATHLNADLVCQQRPGVRGRIDGKCLGPTGDFEPTAVSVLHEPFDACEQGLRTPCQCNCLNKLHQTPKLLVTVPSMLVIRALQQLPLRFEDAIGQEVDRNSARNGWPQHLDHHTACQGCQNLDLTLVLSLPVGVHE
mmetsp:Transcript_107365/g.299089  ORF Transcript_107365/g.299089 Transcript_107365/m.299089 type:complete len:276 (+) Transcript_107365:325-1152(+)